ncbi:MAG: DUF2520 domain-containing protein [Acidimicrobiia bacterium]|nr:DUF2520 domain-containing protein [Acidimicrobiia bacterium]
MTGGTRAVVGIVGPGRAGTAIVTAMVEAGWSVGPVAGRGPDREAVGSAADRWAGAAVSVAEVAPAADMVVIGTPDREIESVARAIAPTVRPDTLVLHLSGARGLDVLAGLPCRVGALHPLQTFAARFDASRVAGSWCAITGDPQVEELARAIGMTPFALNDDDRASYHAAACLASNHLVTLMAQVEATTTVPLEAFGPLVRATIDNVMVMGPAPALTGPVARGDFDSVRRHLAALPPGERDAYLAMARRTAVLAGREFDLGGAPS